MSRSSARPVRALPALAGAGALAAVAAGFLLLAAGQNASAAPGAQPGAAPTGQPIAAPVYVKVPTVDDAVGRDPFRPLYVAPAAGPNVAGASSPASSTPSTAGGSSAGSSAGASPTSGGQAASSATPGGTRVSVLDVYAKDGRSYAQVKVGGGTYAPSVGEVFATTFKLVAVHGSCATMLNGDERFELCKNQEVLK